MHLLLAAALFAQTELGADLSFYRFWRGPNVTSVVGVVTIPLARLQFAEDTTEVGQAATYKVEVVFRDSSGTVLRRDGWSQRVSMPEGQIAPAAQSVETLAFDLHPGRYELDVTVTDSASGVSSNLRRTLRATGERPMHGDLLLASAVERAAEGEQPRQGTINRNSLVLTPNLGRVVADAGVGITLFTEVYPKPNRTDTAAVSVTVRRVGTDFKQERRFARKVYPANGGVELLHIPLAGLQPGDYMIGLKVEYPDTTLVIERGLVVATPLPLTTGGLFEGLDAEALDSIFRVAGYLADAGERRIYPTLSPDAKRRFMERFWARRDPTPGLPNEAYEEYKQRVDFANRNFSPRGGQPGWATDRGRIHITHGPPAERYVQPTTDPGGREKPFEIWKYASGKQLKYVFYDQSGSGLFHLVYSTDPREASMPNWERNFSGAALDLIRRF